MKTPILLFLTSLILIAGTCNKEDEDCHKTIVFKNQTENALYLDSSYLYPDTLLISNPNPSPALLPNRYKVFPNETNKHSLGGRDCIESAYKYSIPSDTLMVYVFDATVLETTPWETVISDNLVLKRYDLSLEDLQNMGWVITYQ